MKLKNVAISVYLLIGFLLFISFSANLFVWVSFFFNFVVLSTMILYHLYIEKHFSPFISSYVVFNFLFFLVAPMVQINGIESSNNLFPNFFPYHPDKVVYTNIILLMFHVVFFFFYLFFKKRYLVKKDTNKTEKKVFFRPLTLIVLLVLSTIIVFYNFDFIMDQIRESHWKSKRLINLSVSSQLIRRKVLFLIPLGALVLSMDYLKKQKKITINKLTVFCVLLCFTLILLFLKNPLVEKRNAIGPIYITLIFLFYPKLLNTNTKTFVFLFFSLVVLFPAVSSLTHLDASFDEIINKPSLLIKHYQEEGIIKTFSTLHYDAFANVMGTIDYVSNKGLSYGYQLLSALLFFVPRSLWADKPYSTGETIGEYLMSQYDFNYDNLSNPLASEGYVNFGILGSMFFAIALALTIVIFIKWLNSNKPLKRIMAFYFAVHLIFLLRGDFTNGFSYFIGTLIGVLVLPKLIEFFISLSLKK